MYRAYRISESRSSHQKFRISRSSRRRPHVSRRTCGESRRSWRRPTMRGWQSISRSPSSRASSPPLETRSPRNCAQNTRSSSSRSGMLDSRRARTRSSRRPSRCGSSRAASRCQRRRRCPSPQALARRPCSTPKLSTLPPVPPVAAVARSAAPAVCQPESCISINLHPHPPHQSVISATYICFSADRAVLCYI